MSCGAPEQGGTLDASRVAGETVIEGRLLRDGAGVAGGYVRLLDAGGEFTAEVVTGAGGDFRFFAAPGAWTLRGLAPGARGEQEVRVAQGVTTVQVELAAT